MPNLGLLAASEIGVAPQRLALVPSPGTNVVAVIAALLDGIDLVVVAADELIRDGLRSQTTARQWATRARHRGAVLIPFISGNSWLAADLTLLVTDRRWTGIGAGPWTCDRV
jgi:hypothetical protein